MHTSKAALLVMLVAWLPAADWLMPGVHELKTSREQITCTVVVPPAVADGKPLPALFLVAPDGKPDPKVWSEWSERRGVVVVGISGLVWSMPVGGYSAPTGVRVENAVDRWSPVVSLTEKVYDAVLAALKPAVPLHPFLRYVVAPKAGTAIAIAMIQDSEEEFGGLLLLSPWVDASAGKYLRKDVPLVMVVGEDNINGVSMCEKLLFEAGTLGTAVRMATVDDLADEVPSMDVNLRAMDWLMNIARVTHEKFSARERKDNLEQIAEQAQELPGLVSPGARRECAGFLMAVPGMDKLARQYEQLADVWVESSLEIAKARESEDAIDAHAFLSVVAKSSRFKEAGGKQRKAVQTELTRMRKNPAIRQEVAAADLLADTCAMLDHDDSTAKQRIALKDLQAMMAQYPKTQAAKVAAKLVTKIQQNLR
jgi:hypothetical protein